MELTPADPERGSSRPRDELPEEADQGRGLTRLLSVLRKQGDEVQFTKAIAAVAESDPQFASNLVRAVLEKAPNRDAATALLERLPEGLACRAERTLPALGDRSRGRIDLEFEEPDDFHLLIEAKIHADYDEGQLQGYLDASSCDGLVGLVRNPPPSGFEPEDDRWLGSVRWGEVLEDWLALEHADPSVTIAWRQLLELAREQGDLGLMDFNHEDIRAWNRYKEGQAILMSLLNEICDGVRQAITEEWRDYYGETRGDPQHVDQVASRIWNTQLIKRFDLPNARGAERFQISFVGGRDHLLFTAEGRWGGDTQELTDDQLRDLERSPVGTKLLENNFEQGAYYGNYWTRPHEESLWLKEDYGETQIVLIESAREDFRDLLESGLFEDLPTTDIPR